MTSSVSDRSTLIRDALPEASRRGKLDRACLLALISCAQSSPKWPLPHNLKLPEITMTTHLKQLLGSALLLGGLVAL
jgi:hypothetical protein